MDENDKPDGSTAMERLCRELMDAVVRCVPMAWCEDHGLGIHGTRPEKDRERARADIERRIADARADDSGVHPWTMYEMAGLREKSAGLDALCRVLNAESADEAVAVARALAEEHYELKKLREAGRVVPEGCRWPSFGDGGRLALGGEAWTKDGGRVRVVAVSHRGRAAVRPWGRKDGRGARWVPLSSLLGERPDSWWRLREDARKGYTAYWGCIGFCCDKCPALVDGKKPNERYGTAGCHMAKQLDLLARAERLAGVQGE